MINQKKKKKKKKGKNSKSKKNEHKKYRKMKKTGWIRSNISLGSSVNRKTYIDFSREDNILLIYCFYKKIKI